MAQPPQVSPVESVSGTIQHLTYFNTENGYFVAKVNIPGKGERTVVGNAPVISVGEQISARGTWKSSSWGPQFKATDVQLMAPTALDGIEKYLSTSISGIGKGYAKKMLAAFGDKVFDVIEKTPEMLFDVKGIGKKRAESILAAYGEQQSIRKIMVFLHKVGLSTNRAKKVHAIYGDSAVAKIMDNPYILCKDIWGVGFSTADGVAQKQGIAPDSEYRIRAGIQHVLREAESQGSCGLPVDMVLDKAGELLTMDYDSIRTCIEYEVQAEQLVRGEAAGVPCLFQPTVYANERYIARRLLEHSARVPARTIPDLDRRISDAQVEIGIHLEAAQLEAVRVALSNNVCVLTGGPGTGKTTITRVILHVLLDAGIDGIALSAPTGKAAKRASEATGHDALTLHRTLEFEKAGGFKRNENNPLEADVMGVDESSMMDVSITASVMRALSPETRLLLIGDVDQLPSVGAGKVLSDIIDSGVIPTVRLSAIFRQAATSDIILNAHAINRGEMPSTGWREGSDFCFTDISPKDKDDEAEKKQCRLAIEAEILRLTRDMYKLGFDPVRDVQVLAPMRRGILGVENLNNKLQALLNPHPEAMLEVVGAKWGTGDKVMQIKNNYDRNVFNGDIGYISEIDVATRLIIVDFDGNLVPYKSADMEELRLAYALTIHKSQGSEFPVVLMPLAMEHWTMLKRNLVYTGVTRARKLCVVVGQKMAMRKAIESAQNDERFSLLMEWLRKGLPAELKSAMPVHEPEPS